jgi:hypothetical protein
MRIGALATVLFFVASLAACSNVTNGAPVGSPPPAATIGNDLSPFVVDFAPRAADALLVGLRDGAVIVQFDAQGLRILEHCSAGTESTGYTIRGVRPIETRLDLSTEEELVAKLPRTGATLARDLAGDLPRGAHVRIDAVVAFALSLREVSERKALRGACEGASHVVKRAKLGAFQLSVDRSSIRYVATAFTSRLGPPQAYAILREEGSAAACAMVTPDTAAPPAQCSAVVSIDLEPLR